MDAAAEAGGGTVVLPAGSLTWDSTVTVDDHRVALVGAGSSATSITGPSGSTALRVKPTPFTVEQAQRIGGFSIVGSGAGAGLHVGDIVGCAIDDVNVSGYTSGTGVWFENSTHWTERTIVTRLAVSDCQVGVRWSMSGGGRRSFGFSRLLDVRLNVGDSQTGMLFEDDSLFYSGYLGAICNLEGDGKILHVTDTACLSGVTFDLAGEQAVDTGPGQGIVVDSSRLTWGWGKTKFDQIAHSGNYEIEMPTAKVFSASGPVGTVVGKVKMLDAAGATVGWMPVYDAIT